MSGALSKCKPTSGLKVAAPPDVFEQNHYLKLNLKEGLEMAHVFYNPDGGNKYSLETMYSYAHTPPMKINLKQFTSNNDDDTLHYKIHLHSSGFKVNYILEMEKPHCVTINNKNCIRHTLAEQFSVAIHLFDAVSKRNGAFLCVLKCPVCMDTINTPNIRTCKTTHSFCQVCFNQLLKCPLCQHTALQVRSENSLKNNSIVCNFKGSSAHLLKQETTCNLNYECPFKISSINCQFVGDKNELIQHCFNKHSPRITKTNEFYHSDLFVTTYGRKDFAAKNEVIYAHANLFQIHKKLMGDDVFWTIKLYGSREEAENYTFSLLIQDGKNKMKYTDVCKSVTDKTDIVENGLYVSLKPLESISKNAVWKITITEGENTN